jgi:hypothetical protein
VCAELIPHFVSQISESCTLFIGLKTSPDGKRDCAWPGCLNEDNFRSSTTASPQRCLLARFNQQLPWSLYRFYKAAGFA